MTPSCDELTMNCCCLYGTTAKSVTKSTWRLECAASAYPASAEDDENCPVEEEVGEFPVDVVIISINTSTPSIIFDLEIKKK